MALILVYCKPNAIRQIVQHSCPKYTPWIRSIGIYNFERQLKAEHFIWNEIIKKHLFSTIDPNR